MDRRGMTTTTAGMARTDAERPGTGASPGGVGGSTTARVRHKRAGGFC